MARRKRLSFDTIGLERKAQDLPPQGDAPALPAPASPVAASRTAPIAQVVGESSAQAALAALTADLEEARTSGRLMLRLGLEQIDAAHLQRDRLRAEPGDMADLIASIRARGQQMPIEVTALGGGRFGLISGWRRLAALRHLQAETGDPAFAQVLAVVRTPESLADAYRAMVEENEIRAGISYYERARIAALAAGAGIYPDARAAIAGLFAAASRAKRSKIGSFLVLHEQLDGQLRFAAAIPERLGLALARALGDNAGFGRRLADRLRKARPATAAAELALLEKALATPAGAGDGASPVAQPGAVPGTKSVDRPADSAPQAPHREEIRPGIWLETVGGFSHATLTLSGAKVDGPLRARLIAWLCSEP